MSNLNLYRIEKDHIRENLNKSTRKTSKMLPECENHLILDIGCGTGALIIELARISDGQFIGIDIDESSLSLLQRKIKKTGLNNRVSIIKGPMLNMNFPEKNFDII